MFKISYNIVTVHMYLHIVKSGIGSESTSMRLSYLAVPLASLQDSNLSKRMYT